MPRGFGGARVLLLLPWRAVAAAPCAARPVAGGSDGDQDLVPWSTLQHPGLHVEWVLLFADTYCGRSCSCVGLLPHLPESRLNRDFPDAA